MKATFLVSLSLRVLCCATLANVTFSSFATAFISDEVDETSKNKSNLTSSSQQENILRNKEILPINARISALLVLLQEEPNKSLIKAQEVLPQLEEISATFNVAEQYLMLHIRGLVEHNGHNYLEAISWLEKTISLRDRISKKQLFLPDFSEVNFILAKSFASLGDFKQAFEYKEKYILGGYRYFDETRIEKIEELNKIYETDHKIKQNELLTNQNKIKRLRILDAENKKFTQQRNIAILTVTVFIFFILLMKQIKVRKKLTHLAKIDSLTGLYNRRTLFEEGTKAVETAIIEKQSLSVILLDIDFFKNINDTYGHDIGDEVIKIIAQLGNETMRSRDVFARLGGEEFTGVLPGVGCAEAKAIAERLREKIASIDLSVLKLKEPVTASIGVACLDQVAPNFDDLLNAADLAMYFAKANGRNRVCQYNDEIEK
jgi:diguanylate cyclase (GGDEF)-like protein